MKNKMISKIVVAALGAIMLFSSVTAFAAGDNSGIVNEINDFENNHPVNQGAVSYVYLNKDTVLKDGILGYTDLSGDKIANNEDSIFQWGSASSILVYISVMQLIEEGKIEYEKDIFNYLPESFTSRAKLTYPITIKNLLNHSSGFQENLYERYVVEGSAYKDLETLLADNVPKQIYAPGTAVAYSEYAVCLGALMVSNVSEMPYEEYVRTHIFDKLDMTKTSIKADFSDNEFVNTNRINTKSYQNGVLFSENSLISPYYPANMVAGTVNDFAKLNQALLNSDSGLFKSKDTYDRMLTPTLLYRNSESARIANGLLFYDFENQVMGMQASSRTQNCVFYINPETKEGLVIMSNIYLEKEYSEGLSKLIFGEVSTSDLSGMDGIGSYAGIYLPSNTIIKGKLSFYSVMNALRLTKVNENVLGLASYNDYPYFTQIDEGKGVMENGSVARFAQLSDGTNVIELPHLDFIPFSSVSYYVGIITFIAQAASYCVTSLILLIGFFRFIFNKIKKTPEDPHPFRKYVYIQCLNNTLFSLIFLFMVISAISYASQMFISMTSLMYWLGSLASVVYIMFLFKTGRNEKVSRVEKIIYYVTAASGFIMIVFAIYYRLILIGA